MKDRRLNPLRTVKIGTMAAVLLSAASAPIAAQTGAVENDPVVDAQRNSDHSANINEAADRFNLPQALIRAVIAAESAGDTNAVSPRGAMGLMQLMPGTYADLREALGLGDDPFDVHDNIIAGAGYLQMLLDRFGRNGFLAAYHAGPRRFERYLTAGVPLPQETIDYVGRVTSLAENATADLHVSGNRSTTPWQSAPLFVGRSEQATIDVVSTTALSFPHSLSDEDTKATDAPRSLFVRTRRVQ